MPLLGMSKLEAVNEMLEAVGEQPFSALDTTGTSVASLAERVLDRIDRRIQEMGWPENTVLFVNHSPAANVIQLGTETLWIRGSGRSRGMELTIRDGFVYNAVDNTVNFSAPVTLDMIVKLDFEGLTPRTKELIATAASTIFQRRWRGNPAQDVYLEQERIIADLVADRIRMGQVPQPINPYPIAPSARQPTTQQ